MVEVQVQSEGKSSKTTRLEFEWPSEMTAIRVPAINLSDNEVEQAMLAVFSKLVGGVLDLTGKLELPRSADYFGNKLKQGWTRFSELKKEKQKELLETAKMPCECCEVVLPKGRKCKVFKPDAHCFLCGGKGERLLNNREKWAFLAGIKAKVELERRDTRGEGCCADYVVESTNRMSEHGYWNEPTRLDGFGHQGWYKYGHNPEDDVMVTLTVPIQVYRPGTKELIAVKYQEVTLHGFVDRTPDRWKPLRSALVARKKELASELASELTSDRSALLELQFLVQQMLMRMAQWGDLPYGRDQAQKVLKPETFDQVRELWPDVITKTELQKREEMLRASNFKAKAGK